MTSFRVGIISSMRMSGGKPRSSKAGSAKAPASDREQKNAGVRMLENQQGCGGPGPALNLMAQT